MLTMSKTLMLWPNPLLTLLKVRTMAIAMMIAMVMPMVMTRATGMKSKLIALVPMTMMTMTMMANVVMFSVVSYSWSCICIRLWTWFC